jgi:V/A-type H+-transporting ATPase subunit C
MKPRSRLDYAYSVGRVRALERGLISSSVLREAADQKDYRSAVKVVADAGVFFHDWADIRDVSQLDEFLEYEDAETNKSIEELLLNQEFFRILEMSDRPEDALTDAEKADIMFMADYFRHSIDLGNLKTFLRLKYLGFPVDRLKDRITRGGLIEEKTFIDNFELSFSEFGEKLHASPYQDVWERATDVLNQEETFVMMERGFEDFLMNYLRRARYIVFGPEPVFAYALARKRELKLIRLVVNGMMNQIPAGMIKQRISKTYV